MAPEPRDLYTRTMDILIGSLAAALVLAFILLAVLGRPAPERSQARRPGQARSRQAKRRKAGPQAAGAASRGSAGAAILPHTCPLCGTALETGQRVKSDITPGKGDRMMRIYGCPHCWPATERKAPRLCPVCGKELPSEGFVVARYFESPGRKHVHVLGCSLCRNNT